MGHSGLEKNAAYGMAESGRISLATQQLARGLETHLRRWLLGLGLPTLGLLLRLWLWPLLKEGERRRRRLELCLRLRLLRLRWQRSGAVLGEPSDSSDAPEHKFHIFAKHDTWLSTRFAGATELQQCHCAAQQIDQHEFSPDGLQRLWRRRPVRRRGGLADEAGDASGRSCGGGEPSAAPSPGIVTCNSGSCCSAGMAATSPTLPFWISALISPASSSEACGEASSAAAARCVAAC